MNIPITQSKAWEKLQSDLGQASILRKGNDYQFLAIIMNTPLGDYLYCPYGPVAENKRAFKESLHELEQLARQNQAIFIRIEPQNPDFTSALPKNAKKTTDLNPKETWVLDLTGEEETFTGRLPSRLLRYHRAAERKGIAIRKTNDPSDIKYLTKLQNALAKEKGINTFSEHYLKTELSQPFATLYIAEYEGDNQSTNPQDGSDTQLTAAKPTPKQLIAAGLVFDDTTTRYNLQGAQSELGRKLHATGILTIELIKDAREKGLKTFDFWGIAPEGAPKNHSWAGFTEFKKSFHGEPRNYLGTYDLPLKKAKYAAYEALRKLNRIRRKI